MFKSLLDPQVQTVAESIRTIKYLDVNSAIFSYLLILTRFHWNTEIRKLSRKIITEHSSEEFLKNYSSKWKNRHRTTQDYSHHKIYYQNEYVNTKEYFLFAYKNRRNYFTIQSIEGQYNIHNRLTGDRDEIINVFECYGENIIVLPTKIIFESEIGVVKIMNAPKLDFQILLAQLTYLPNLHNLKLWTCGIKSIPEEINKLKHLKRLDLHNNNIKSVDKRVYLPKLEFLGLEGIGLSELNLKCFPNLKFLSVNRNYKIKFKNVVNSFNVGYGTEVYKIVEPK